jgi:hypothetical protein
MIGLVLNLDFGHANFGKDNHHVFCKELGHDIQHVHFSDNRGRDDNPMPLEGGSINWNKGIIYLFPAVENPRPKSLSNTLIVRFLDMCSLLC